MEVFKIIGDQYFDIKAFVIGGHTIEFDTFSTLVNNPNYNGYSNTYFGQKTLCLLDEEVKPIGKLTIKSIK